MSNVDDVVVDAELVDAPTTDLVVLAGEITFRCPHRPWQHANHMSRQQKAMTHAHQYVVPADTVWTRVDHVIPPDKASLYAHEKGYTYEADLVCPECGDTIRFSTDQEPEK
jgi:formamidopyrimidine-DNA glycosylase